LIFGNPTAGNPLMQSQQTIGLDLPPRVLVWRDEGGMRWLKYHPLDFLAQQLPMRPAKSSGHLAI
jgi:uncharacterized protein (DUF302 family)